MNDDEEYNDIHYINNILDKFVNLDQSKTDTLRLTTEFNEKFFQQFQKNIEITPFSVIIDDIKNYRTLTELQLIELKSLSDEEKIKIIKLYNTMFSTLENIII
jgi:hypothetical protein